MTRRLLWSRGLVHVDLRDTLLFNLAVSEVPRHNNVEGMQIPSFLVYRRITHTSKLTVGSALTNRRVIGYSDTAAGRLRMYTFHRCLMMNPLIRWPTGPSVCLC